MKKLKSFIKEEKPVGSIDLGGTIITRISIKHGLTNQEAKNFKKDYDKHMSNAKNYKVSGDPEWKAEYNLAIKIKNIVLKKMGYN